MKKIIYIFILLSINIVYGKNFDSMEFRKLMFESSMPNYQKQNKSVDSYSTSLRRNTLRDMVIAGILPGSRQFVNGQKKKALLLLSIESIALSSYVYNSLKGQEVQDEYQSYAKSNWSFSKWVSDYYSWRGDTESGHLFNNADSSNNLGPCGLDSPFGNPTFKELYPCIDEGHGIAYSIDIDGFNGRQETNHSSFEQVYKLVCGVNDYDGDESTIDEDCSYEDEVVSALLEQYNFELYYDHHYYENIGKYDSFFAGWSDNSEIYGYTKSNGDMLAMSPHKSTYRDIWSQFNEGYLRYASYSLAALTANHFISMLDILISNTTDDRVSINSNANFSRFDLYKIKLSVKF